MEILKGYKGIVKFPVPSDLTNATVTVTRNGVESADFPVSGISGGVAQVQIPYAQTTSDGDLTVSLNFNYEGEEHVLTKTVTIVTPYLDIFEVKELLLDATDDEAIKIEAAVRHIINAHTGQVFGKFAGTKIVSGAGAATLALPARLISLNGITLDTPGLDLYGTFQIAGDGWYLKPNLFSAAETIEFTGVISNPYSHRASVFNRDVRYSVDGVWGWEEVPDAIREATKLLIGDYSEMDSAYRDRYLDSLTSPDWRIQFHSGAFKQTGNIRADQLLNEYVLQRGWTVI